MKGREAPSHPRVVLMARLLGCLVLGCLVLGCLVLAALPSQARARPGPLTIFDLLPAKYSRSALSDQMDDILDAPFRLELTDASLVATLQWSYPDQGAGICGVLEPELLEMLRASKLVHPPTGPGDILPLLLEQARVQNQQGRHSEALESLKQARRVLPCQKEILTSELVFRLFWLEAQAHAMLQDGMEVDAFADALQLNPKVSLPDRPHALLRQAFIKGQKQHQARDAMPIDLKGLEGSRVLYGGVEIGPGWRLQPGRHVFQVQSPAGAIRTMLLVIPPTSPVLLADLMELDLPSLPRTLELLVASLRSGAIETSIRQAIDGWMRGRGIDAMAFVVETVPAGRPWLRVYQRGRGLLDPGEIRVVQDPEVVNHMRIVQRPPAPSVQAGAGWRPSIGGLRRSVRALSGLELSLRAAMPVGRLQLEGLVGGWRSGASTQASEGGCQAGEDATSSCGGEARGWSGAFSVGVPIPVRERLWVVPSLGLEVDGLSVWVTSPAQDAASPSASAPPGSVHTESVLTDTMAVGPRVGSALQYALHRGSVRAQVGLELGATFAFARSGGEWRVWLPVGGSLLAGVAF